MLVLSPGHLSIGREALSGVMADSAQSLSNYCSPLNTLALSVLQSVVYTLIQKKTCCHDFSIQMAQRCERERWS